MNLTTKGLAAAALTTTLLAAGCTSSGNSTGDPASPPSASTGSTSGSGSTAPDQTAAAGLRATLTALLSDHVKGAVAALDENSVALAKTLGSVYPAAQKPFLASWRQHIGFFVNYTLGKATKNAAMANKARADLDGYRTSFGQLIHSVVPELPADAVAQELVPHVQSLLTAVDAAVAGSPQFQTKLTDAAEHMTMTAAVLTGGIVADQMITD
jgi:hypothetical protein